MVQNLLNVQYNSLDGRYTSRQEFMADIALIYDNSKSFNGPEHSVTVQAHYVQDFTRALMEEFDMTLAVLEENIQKNAFDDDYDEPESTGRRRGSEGYQPESMVIQTT